MRRTRFLVPALLLSLASPALHGQGGASPARDFVFPGETATLPAPLPAVLASLKTPALAAHVSFLASPGLEGRGLGQSSLDATAEYLAAVLATSGIAPLLTPSGGTPAAYFQAVPVREVTRPSGSITVVSRAGEAQTARVFRAGVDGVFPELPPGNVSGTAVFAGYGIRESSPQRDDYRDLSVKDRIVVIHGGVPPGPEWQTKALTARYAAESGRRRYAAKAEMAASLGARAIVAIEDETFAGALLAGTDAPAPRYFLPYAPAPDPRSVPVFRVSPAVGAALLASSGLDLAASRLASPRALPETLVTAEVTGEERLVVSRNVLAVLPGSDPAVHDQAVVIGAHMDHLGRSGDRIYPGADDNASGVAALIEIAKAFAASPVKPRRTLVFAFWTGEEEGHLGSEYFVRHPAWPIERTAVYLNLDMIGHPWKMDEIRQLVTDTKLPNGAALLAAVKAEDFLELGMSESAPDLAPVLMQAARGTGVALHLDRTDGKSGGSDYRAYARRDVPFVRFFGNYFDGYHEPSDTADALDAAQVLKMARLACASAWLLANR